MARIASFKPTETEKGWRVNIPAKLSTTGARQQRYFPTKKEADSFLHALKVRKENHGSGARLLRPHEEEQAAAAIGLLRAEGIERQLVEIVGEYIERQRQRSRSITLKAAWVAYVAKCKSDGLSDSYLKGLALTKRRFESLMEKLLCNIDAREIEEVLQGASGSYRNSLLRVLRAVLNFAMHGSRGWLQSNPADDVEFVSRKLGEVRIYTPEEIERLMNAVLQNDPVLLASMALMIFAGIRPDESHGEITQLRWEHVVIEKKHKRLHVPESISKTGKRRDVTIRPALAAWLARHRELAKDSKGLICPVRRGALRKRMRAIFTAANVTRIQDGFRKSFATYLASMEDLDTAEKELGHIGGREVMNRHYRTDVRQAVARKFWSIRPERHASNITPFSAAAA